MMESSIAGGENKEDQRLENEVAIKDLLNIKGKDEIREILDTGDYSMRAQTAITQFIEFRENEVNDPLQLYTYLFQIAVSDSNEDFVQSARNNIIKIMQKSITPYTYFLSEEFFVQLLEYFDNATTPELPIFLADFIEAGYGDIDKSTVKFDNELLYNLFQHLVNIDAEGAILTLEQICSNLFDEPDEATLELLSDYVNSKLHTLDENTIWLTMPVYMAAHYKLSIDFSDEVVEIIQNTNFVENPTKLRLVLHLIKYSDFPMILSEDDFTLVFSNPNNEYFSEYTQILRLRYKEIPTSQLIRLLTILVDLINSEETDHNVKNEILTCLSLLDSDILKNFPSVFLHLAQNLDDDIMTGQPFVKGLCGIADESFISTYPDMFMEIISILDSKSDVLDELTNCGYQLTESYAELLLKLIEIFSSNEQ